MQHASPTHEDAHLRILRLLEQQPDLNQRELAAALGVSLGKANYLLRALLDKGLVKARNFRSSDNKLSYAYLLTPSGLSHKTLLLQRYLERKSAEYDALRSEISALRTELLRSR
jgi:EPS-associated MarR family transcriptional regulator